MSFKTPRNYSRISNERNIISDDTVRIVATGDIYEIEEFNENPVILAGLLVQEDFIIMERRKQEGTWNFACGVAAFSFAELGINGERGFMTPG